MKQRFAWSFATVCLAACGGASAVPDDVASEDPPGFELPVVTNAESPVRYPPALYRRNVGGTVVLRLFVDSAGVVAPESTEVAEGSGTPALDSAALAHVADMRFAPGRRNGVPAPVTFLQPVVFEPPEPSPE